MLEKQIGREFDCEPFFQSSQNLLGILDAGLCLLASNPAMSKMLNVPHEVLLGQSLLNFFHADDVAHTKVKLNQLLEHKNGDRFAIECRVRGIDGKYAWMKCQYWIVRKESLIYFVGVDQTSTKRDRTLLREIQKCAKVGGWEVDVVTHKLYWSEETHEIIGTDPKTYVPTLERAYDCYLPESREKVIELVRSGLEEMRAFTFDAWIHRGEGRVPVRVVSKVDVQDGKLRRLYGTFQDISEQKQHELELIEREHRLNLVIEAGNIGFWTWYTKTDEVIFSERLCEMLGLEYTGLKRPLQEWVRHVHPDDLPGYVAHIESARGDGDHLFRTTIRVGHVDGRWLQILSQGKTVLHDDNGDGLEFIGIVTDVTAETENQMRMADQIQKSIVSQKLAALGEMAAGIAHEINNPLAVIAGRAAKFARRLDNGDVDHKALAENLKIIEDTSFRIAKIISGLTHFAHESEQVPQTQEVFRTILEDTLVFCAERFRNNGVELKLDERDESATILCAPLQISQVILNMLNNAYDAVQNSENKWVKVEAGIDGNNLIVAVTDSGPRIDPETQSKMMNPFFSTKGVGKGTGLGLSVSKGIIESHGGRFYYHAESPNTCFVFELPILT